VGDEGMKLFNNIKEKIFRNDLKTKISTLEKRITGLQQRSFIGAITDRLVSGWVTDSMSGDSDLRYSLPTLRSRSRDLAQNNNYVRKSLNLIVVNVVGEGITLQNKAVDPNGQLDSIANNLIRLSWDAWSKRGTATICGKYSLVDALRLIIRTTARDGECLIRLIYPAENKWSFSLMLIEADQLDTNYNDTLSNGNTIRMAIEYDARTNRPIAYHVLTAFPNDYLYNQTIKTERIPADQIIHLYMPERISSGRGVPWCASALRQLKQLDKYSESELVASVIGAASCGFLTSSNSVQYTGDSKDADGNVIIEADPGTIRQLPPNMDFKQFQPTRPSTEFSQFYKSILRGIAAGIGISYNAISSDLESVNYSSLRMGAIEDRDNYKIIQDFLIDNVMDIIFSKWLEMALLTQAVKLPFSKFEKFNQPSWRPRGWDEVDSLKDVNADILAINNKIKTRSQVLAERGINLDDHVKQLELEDKLFSQLSSNDKKEEKQNEQVNQE
jgi:lambda family phage portal protein